MIKYGIHSKEPENSIPYPTIGITTKTTPKIITTIVRIFFPFKVFIGLFNERGSLFKKEKRI